MPNWTTSQRDAIDSRDLTLLVSAGAGSGKTTVLTRRIIERIERGDSVMDFLIVTFTNASAADLKEKLYQAISRLAAEHPQDRRYRAQLYLLPSARISTIDAFCGGIVRANFQALGLSPKFRQADEKETRLLAFESLEDAADAFSEREPAAYALLCDTFSDGKGDGRLLEVLFDLYGRLRAFDDPFGWLAEKGKTLLSDAERLSGGGDVFETAVGNSLRELLLRRLEALSDEADELCVFLAGADGSPNGKAAEYLRAQARLLYDAAKRSYAVFAAAAKAFCTAGVPSMQGGKLSAADRERYKTARAELKDGLTDAVSPFLAEPADAAEQFEKTGRVIDAMLEFLREFDGRYAALKRERGVIDFADAPHFLLQLLEKDGEPTPFCLAMRRQIREIYIDEYQDVSPLQDRLFSLLSDGRNRFMVGDVKQSIYRFRNAYPDIFLDYKDRFADYEDAKNDPNATQARVFLRDNFRCGERIVRFVNMLFRVATVGTAYEREYRGEELVFAKDTDAEPYPVTVAVAPYEKDASLAQEREAAFIADEIVRLLSDGRRETPDGPVPYRYRDVVLLFSALKGHTAVYEKALRERGIPCRVTTENPFFDRPEILLAVAMLRAVDDPTDDVSLFAMLRSPVGGFSAGEVYAVRCAMRESGPLCRALRYAAEGGGALAEGLPEKCAGFLANLDRMRLSAEGMPCHAFLWELYTRYGLLSLCNRRERNGLLLLFDFARRFESGGYKGLSGFLSYLRASEERQLDPSGGEDGGDEDCVLLTSIHKSKGLEYETVFLCDCERDLFGRHTQKSYTLLRKDGIFFRLRDPERLTERETLLNSYASMAERDAAYGEELRKLYVACTRARERLYLVGKCKRSDLDGDFHRRSPRSVLDIVMNAVLSEQEPDCRVLRMLPETAENRAEEAVAPPPEPTEVPAEPSFLTPEAIRAVRFAYPFRDSDLPAKVSVSALKEGTFRRGAVVEYGASSLLRTPSFIGGTVGGTAADAGTANHVFLQFCRWENVEKNGVHAEVERLRAARMLREEQLSLLDENGLERFFRSSLYARIRASSAVYREQRFSVRVPATLLGGDEGEDVLLQGVIDCFFAEADGSMTVVDYKTDRISDGALLRKKHALQLECYRRAVERMTGRPVRETLLWSFYLDREV